MHTRYGAIARMWAASAGAARSCVALSYAVLACASFTGVTSCASSPLTGIARPEAPVVWPEGDEAPRIELLYTYSGTDRAQAGRGLFASLGDLFAGSETFEFGSPYGIAGSLEQQLFITDAALSAVHVIDFQRETHSLLGGGPESPLSTPMGVALAPDGRLFVTDSSAACIHVFNSAGELLGSFGSEEELGRPTGIAYDETNDRLLITDTIGGRILAYSLEGEQLSVHGERGDQPGQFNFPTNIALTPDGRVIVVDTMNFRIQTLTAELEPESEFGLAGDGPGTFARPKGIGMDSDGHIYVVDAMFDNVQIFDSHGQLMLTFAARGSGLGKLFLPSGILIDGEDHVIIADAGNSRLQVFQYHSQAQ